MLNSTLASRGAALTMLSLLALGTSACAGPRMVVPSDVLSVSRAFEAENRSRVSGLFADKSFKLGAYQVAEFDRDANSKSLLNIGGTEVNWGTTEITCTCESEGSTSKVQITGTDNGPLPGHRRLSMGSRARPCR